jgi:hypothetical protein
MCAIGRALMANPKMVLLDEPSMGLAPQIVEEVFEIVKDLNQREKVTFLLAEQNTNMALRYADYGYILENGRIVMDGEAQALRENEDVKEFYLGMGGGDRKSFKGGKSYKRRKRWLSLTPPKRLRRSPRGGPASGPAEPVPRRLLDALKFVLIDSDSWLTISDLPHPLSNPKKRCSNSSAACAT